MPVASVVFDGYHLVIQVSRFQEILDLVQGDDGGDEDIADDEGGDIDDDFICDYEGGDDDGHCDPRKGKALINEADERELNRSEGNGSNIARSDILVSLIVRDVMVKVFLHHDGVLNFVRSVYKGGNINFQGDMDPDYFLIDLKRGCVGSTVMRMCCKIKRLERTTSDDFYVYTLHSKDEWNYFNTVQGSSKGAAVETIELDDEAVEDLGIDEVGLGENGRDGAIGLEGQDGRGEVNDGVNGQKGHHVRKKARRDAVEWFGYGGQDGVDADEDIPVNIGGKVDWVDMNGDAGSKSDNLGMLQYPKFFEEDLDINPIKMMRGLKFRDVKLFGKPLRLFGIQGGFDYNFKQNDKVNERETVTPTTGEATTSKCALQKTSANVASNLGQQPSTQLDASRVNS
ncbi:hypothetical protein CJ030_MR2G022360 [Morella rubra]|uniref:Uncharacterized protein n=1 Tax=Morella rubra TaxID=262757 RepID=A0A6A1WGQ4_9ROSI|nr:hypothetical protein CJ030_MR2G022360 [Morella rubra]